MTRLVFWSAALLALSAVVLWLVGAISGGAALGAVALCWTGANEFGLQALADDTHKALRALSERVRALEPAPTAPAGDAVWDDDDLGDDVL